MRINKCCVLVSILLIIISSYSYYIYNKSIYDIEKYNFEIKREMRYRDSLENEAQIANKRIKEVLRAYDSILTQYKGMTKKVNKNRLKLHEYKQKLKQYENFDFGLSDSAIDDSIKQYLIRSGFYEVDTI